MKHADWCFVLNPVQAPDIVFNHASDIFSQQLAEMVQQLLDRFLRNESEVNNGL